MAKSGRYALLVRHCQYVPMNGPMIVFGSLSRLVADCGWRPLPGAVGIGSGCDGVGPWPPVGPRSVCGRSGVNVLGEQHGRGVLDVEAGQAAVCDVQARGPAVCGEFAGEGCRAPVRAQFFVSGQPVREVPGNQSLSGHPTAKCWQGKGSHTSSGEAARCRLCVARSGLAQGCEARCAGRACRAGGEEILPLGRTGCRQNAIEKRWTTMS